MEPDIIPVITGAVGGGGATGRPPPSVAEIDAAARERDRESGDQIAALLAAVDGLAAEREAAADDGVGSVVVDAHNDSIPHLKRAMKGVDLIVQDVADQAAEAESKTHAGFAAVGGAPILLTEQAYAINTVGDPFAEAVARIIEPAMNAPVVGADDGEYKAPPPGDVPPDAPNYVPNDPGEPAPPADPTSPPPPDDPYAPPPADGGVCCPPQQIVVPAPIVNIVLPSGITLPYQPPADPTTPAAPPATPTSPPPLIPLVPISPPTLPTPTTLPPPPRVPTGGPINPIPGMGPMDGPNLCELVQSSVGIAAHGDANVSRRDIREAVRQIGIDLAQVPVFGPAVSAMMNAGMGTLWGVQDIIGGMLTGVGIPNPVVAAGDMSIHAITGFLNRWVGIDYSYWLQPSEQTARYANPLNILSQGEVDAAYLNGGLDRSQWECLSRMNGSSPWQHWQAVYGKRTRLNNGELIDLRQRGLVGDEELAALMRQNGVIDPADMKRMLALADYVPTTQELFKWINKDVYNEKFAKDFGLDEDFPNPLPPQIQQWFDANGVTPEQIKYDYRAQWTLASKTQTDEFVRRLRPGRVDPALVFTKEDANQLYKLNEIPAGIRNRMLETSYVPVNRTDLIEAFKAGTVDRKEMRERLQDLGYSPDDATFLTQMIVAKADGQAQSAAGTWTKRRIGKEYKEGTIDRDTAFALLSRTILSPRAATDILDDVDTLRSAEARGKCVKGIKRRYFVGEIDRMEARALLLAQGVDQLATGTLLTGWTCERDSRAKEPTVKMLTEWAVAGIITVVDFGARLVRLGYSKEDADRIIAAAIKKAQKPKGK